MVRILSDIIHILSKFMNFWVAKLYVNNGTFYDGTKIYIEVVVMKCFHI